MSPRKKLKTGSMEIQMNFYANEVKVQTSAVGKARPVLYSSDFMQINFQLVLLTDHSMR